MAKQGIGLKFLPTIHASAKQQELIWKNIKELFGLVLLTHSRSKIDYFKHFGVEVKEATPKSQTKTIQIHIWQQIDYLEDSARILQKTGFPAIELIIC